MATQPIRLGEMLKAQNLITDEQLQQALVRQKKTGEKIGRALISLNFITEQQFLDFLTKQLNLPFYDLRSYDVNPALVQLLPESLARLYDAILLKEEKDHYVIGVTDPLNVLAINKIRLALNKPLQLALVTSDDLHHTFNLVYRQTKEIKAFAQALSQEIHKTTPIAVKTQMAESSNAPIIKLIDSIFQDAAQMNASDIHIEPSEHTLRIRLRIAGILHEQILQEASVMPAIVSRLKLMSGLNISEKRLPQDGRFEITVKQKKFDIRLSTMPTPFGESVVMRLLPQTQAIASLHQTGVNDDILKRLRSIFRKPNGIVLVTGPTGSGKSTTLYAAISEINRPDIK